MWPEAQTDQTSNLHLSSWPISYPKDQQKTHTCLTFSFPFTRWELGDTELILFFREIKEYGLFAPWCSVLKYIHPQCKTSQKKSISLILFFTFPFPISQIPSHPNFSLLPSPFNAYFSLHIYTSTLFKCYLLKVFSIPSK